MTNVQMIWFDRKTKILTKYEFEYLPWGNSEEEIVCEFIIEI